MRHATQMGRTAGGAARGSRTVGRCLHFAGVTLCVQLDNAPDVEIALAQALRGWRFDSPSDPHTTARQTHVWGTRSGFSAQSVYLDHCLDGLGVAGAACAVIADLAQDYFETRPGCLALHCAAFRYADRLIAMTGPSRAGKSTLVARLTQEADMQVFCDDVLPMLDNGQAVGLGIAPRLRLPLPQGSSAAFKSHVAQHIGPRDDRYGYLCAPTVAPHGTRAPLSVLLILDRRSDARPQLHEVAEDEILHCLLSQNMSDLQTADAAFRRLSDLLVGITCLRLVYSDMEDAVALIRQAFGTSAPVAVGIEIAQALPHILPPDLPKPDVSPDLSWCRSPDVVMQRKAESAFLWQPGRHTIWQMNHLALAIWAVLEIPSSAREIGQLLSERFPDQPLDALISDVNALMQALSRQGLIDRAAAPDAATRGAALPREMTRRR